MSGGAASTFFSLFAYGNKVVVDDGDVVATVIGFCFYQSKGTQVQVSWWNNGTLVEQWVDEARLKRKA